MSASQELITDLSGCFTLQNAVRMPYFGLGVYKMDKVADVVKFALESGYRLVDTAAIYENETEVGEGVRASALPREQVFVTSKVWNTTQGYDSTLQAFDDSLKRLGLDYLDLYLIHWPVVGKFKDTWKALERLYKDKRVRAIGVSNFLRHHLEQLLSEAEIVPMVNQMEFHPYLVQQDLLDYCQEKHIQYQAWSPMMAGKVFQLDAIRELAEKYGKTIAQIVLRWDLQKGVATIPKSSNPDRITANADIFDFELLPADVAELDSMDRHKRFGPDPDNFDF